jgi:hypothetical protein
MECGNNCYKICPLMCEVIGEIMIDEKNYNSHKWSNEDPTGRTGHP